MFVKAIIAAAFAVLKKYLIEKIQFVPLRQYFEQQIEPAMKVAELLTDKNPDNSAQLAAFWNENKSTLLSSNLDLAIMIIEEKVTDVVLRDLIVALLKSIKEEQDKPA